MKLHSNLLDYDPEEEELRRTAALAALATEGASARPMLPSNDVEAFTPELDPGSQFPETQGLDPDWSQPVAPPAPDPITATAALAAQSKPAPPPAAAPSTYQAPPAPDAPDPFAALMQRGEESRQRALDEYGKTEPSINGWALLADVAFNKGKSIPQMLAQVDNDKRAWREGRAKLLNGGAHGSDPMSQALAYERIQNAREGNRLRGDAAKAKEAKRVADAEQGIEDREAIIANYAAMGVEQHILDRLSSASPAAFKTMRNTLDKRAATSPDMIQRGADKAGAESGARAHANNLANYDDRGIRADTAGVRADAVAAAQAPHLAVKPQTPDQIRADEMQREGLEETKRTRRLAEQTRADAAKERKDKTETDQLTKYSNDTQKARESAAILDRLEDAISEAEKNGQIAPGLGAEAVLDDWKKAPISQGARGWVAALAGGDEAAYQNAAIENQRDLQRLGTSLYRIDTGASGNAREEIANAIATATSPTATSIEVRSALKVIRGLLETDIGGSGLAVTHPELAGRALVGGGIKDPSRWIKSYHAPQPAAVGGGGGLGGDLELGEGQFEVINEDGDAVVEGAGVEPDFGAAQPPAQLRAIPASPDGSNLGSSGGRGAGTPPAAAPTIPVIIQYQSGRKKPANLTQEQLQALGGRPGIIGIEMQ